MYVKSFTVSLSAGIQAALHNLDNMVKTQVGTTAIIRKIKDKGYGASGDFALTPTTPSKGTMVRVVVYDLPESPPRTDSRRRG